MPERWKRSLKTSDRKLAAGIADQLEDAGRGVENTREALIDAGAQNVIYTREELQILITANKGETISAE